MRTLRFLLQKEFLQIYRNKTILRMIVVMPAIQPLILPWAATFEQKNIYLSVVDNDRSALSTQLREKVIASGYFRLTDYSSSYSQALNAVERNEADLVLEIPRHFETSLLLEQSTGIMLSVNAVNAQKAGLGAAYMGQIILDFNQNLAMQLPAQQSVSSLHATQLIPSFRYNTEMNYRNFMVPGILVMLLTLIGMNLSALNIVKEKEIGTIEQINVTPVRKNKFILAKLIPFWIMGYVIMTLGLGIAHHVYGLLPMGSIGVIYLFAFFYLVAVTGLGLLISTYSDSQQQAMLLAFFFVMIFFLMSGLFTPVSSMPQWAQNITRLNPVRYFVEVMRLVYMKGSGLSDIYPLLLHIMAFGLVFNVWAVLNYKKTS